MQREDFYTQNELTIDEIITKLTIDIKRSIPTNTLFALLDNDKIDLYSFKVYYGSYKNSDLSNNQLKYRRIVNKIFLNHFGINNWKKSDPTNIQKDIERVLDTNETKESLANDNIIFLKSIWKLEEIGEPLTVNQLWKLDKLLKPVR